MIPIPDILPQSFDEFALRIGVLMAALALDWLIGEPRFLWNRLPHPVVLFGRSISFFDKRWNRRFGVTGRGRRLRGTIALILLLIIAGVVGVALSFGGWQIELIALAVLLAGRSLDDHIRAVSDALKGTNINDARRAVAMIVGRSTARMDEGDISRAAIETGAENLSDGVFAPALWFLFLGLPGLFIYKMTNTADSMIGYKTAKYRAFGWAAARFDDGLNYIPARLTAGLIILASIASPGGMAKAILAMHNDAKSHASPNAGWPEAAMAGGLDVWLAGPRAYGQRIRHAARLNKDGAEASQISILQSLHIVKGAQILFAGLLLAMLMVIAGP